MFGIDGIFSHALSVRFLRFYNEILTLIEFLVNVMQFYKFCCYIGVARSRNIESDRDYQINKERVQELKVLWKGERLHSICLQIVTFEMLNSSWYSCVKLWACSETRGWKRVNTLNQKVIQFTRLFVLGDKIHAYIKRNRASNVSSRNNDAVRTRLLRCPVTITHTNTDPVIMGITSRETKERHRYGSQLDTAAQVEETGRELSF